MIRDHSRFSKQFSFTLKTGKELFPIQMTCSETGKLAFRVSPGGKRGNTLEATEQVDEKSMIKRVLGEGWGVRCASVDGKVNGQYKEGHRSVAHVNRHS